MERARLPYEAETYARKKEQTKEVQLSKEQSTNFEDIHYEDIEGSMDLNKDGHRNDWGPPARQQRSFTNEPAADARETSLDKQQKDDKQEQVSSPPNKVKKPKDIPKKDTNVTTIVINGKTTPQPTESTDIHHDVQAVK